MNFILLVAAVAYAAATPITEQWTSFKRQHGKSYHSIEEEKYRMSIFNDNLKFIEEHNTKYEAGHETFYLGMNHFGDMLPEEIFKFEFNQTEDVNQQPTFKFSPPVNSYIPESVDWRDIGAVTPVKNQGNCGSCWAFSTTGAIEGQLFRKTGKLVSLSEQQLMDCTRYVNYGCSGGYVEKAYDYLKDAEGLESADSYPYQARDGRCRYNKEKVVPETKVKAYVEIERKNDRALKAAVATVGPISVGVDANGLLFMFYRGGVFTGYFCGKAINHAVLLVGYGTGFFMNYWTIKNSWGTGWGEEGYMRLATMFQNNCGISDYAKYPILE